LWYGNFDALDSRSEMSGMFKMWCLRKEKISWIDRVKNEEVLHRVEDRNVLHTIRTKTGNSVTSFIGTAF